MPPICNRQPFEVRVNHIRTWLPGTRISNNKNIINKQLWCTTSFQYWKYERPISIMLAYRILISQMNDQMAIPFKSYAFALQANFLVLGYNSLFFTCSQFYALLILSFVLFAHSVNFDAPFCWEVSKGNALNRYYHWKILNKFDVYLFECTLCL